MLRRFVLLSLVSIGSPAAAQDRSRRAVGGPLRLGADSSLIDSGLAHALQQAFMQDTGLAV